MDTQGYSSRTERRELAVISGVSFGMRDGYVCLTFEVHMGSGYASTLSLDTEEAIEMVKEAGVRDVYNINHMVCWVKVSDGICRYDGMFEPDLWTGKRR